jgi:hypothetical protein
MAKHTEFRIRAAFVLAAFSVFPMGGCSSVSPDGKHWSATSGEGPLVEDGTVPSAELDETASREIGVVRQAISGTPDRICTVVRPGNWRDTINVPQTWARATCLVTYKNALGASSARLGCLTSTGYSLATCDNCLPANNSCGW